MVHASLFSGIGGFDLAAAWAGWTNAFNCEIDPFCRKILKYHFPDAEQYADIRTTDFTLWRGRVDVLTGGFPCQPFSLAGKRRGTADDRYLWPEMLRAIREIRPRWVVGENVYGIVNWSRGMVFDEVCADLEDAGYAVLAFVLPACAVGAPHRRDRTWFIAHRADAGAEAVQERQNGIYADKSAADADGHRFGFGANQPKPVAGSCGAADACSGSQERAFADAEKYCPARIPDWTEFPTESPVCRKYDGISEMLGGISFPRWCRESIKAYGNAIVPQVALQIFETINVYESTK